MPPAIYWNETMQLTLHPNSGQITIKTCGIIDMQQAHIFP